MTKQEKIKEAWGEYWNRLSEAQRLIALENNGYTHIGYSKPQVDLHIDLKKSKIFEVHDSTRPKSLEGIENNNGWISFEEKINIEHNSLPLELYNINTKEHYISFDESEFIEIGRFTHYKLIKLSNPPIY